MSATSWQSWIWSCQKVSSDGKPLLFTFALVSFRSSRSSLVSALPLFTPLLLSRLSRSSCRYTVLGYLFSSFLFPTSLIPAWSRGRASSRSRCNAQKNPVGRTRLRAHSSSPFLPHAATPSPGSSRVSDLLGCRAFSVLVSQWEERQEEARMKLVFMQSLDIWILFSQTDCNVVV